jgi:hypothetical protein
LTRTPLTSIFGAPNVTPTFRVACLVDHLGDVQERLGQDTAIQADAARVDRRVDECDLHPAVRRIKRRRVTAGTGANYNNLSR